MQTTRFAHLLSPKQVQGLCALLQGATISDAAAAAGVHRTTFHSWLRHSQAFRGAVAESRLIHATTIYDRLQHLSDKAIGTLEDALNASDAPLFLRVRAALAVLRANHDAAALTERYRLEGDNLPNADLPEDDHATLHDATQHYALTMNEAGESGTTRTSAIPRSAPCPCGSGRKYKRCCGLNAPAVINHEIRTPVQAERPDR